MKKSCYEVAIGVLIAFLITGVPIAFMAGRLSRGSLALEQEDHYRRVLNQVSDLRASRYGNKNWSLVRGTRNGKKFAVLCASRHGSWEAQPSGDWGNDRLAEDYMELDPLIEAFDRLSGAPADFRAEDQSPENAERLKEGDL